MIDSNHIRNLAEQKLEGSELFLADIHVRPGNRIMVFLDGDRGVTIDDCASLSRHLNASLGEETDFELVVSSFGADQPIKLPRQYNKNVGRSLTVRFGDEQTLVGKLLEVSAEGITLAPESKGKKKKTGPEWPERVMIPFDQISLSKVNLSFNQ